MKLEMKVNKVFVINNKTIFTGDIRIAPPYVSSVMCRLLLDGIEIGRVEIEGEVLSNSADRDLWTSSFVDIEQSALVEHDVLLMSI